MDIFSNLKGYALTSRINCRKDENNYWVVEQKITQAKSEDGENWKETSATSSATDKDMSTAVNQCYLTLSYYLQSVEGDMFTLLESNNESDSSSKVG